MKTKQLIVLFLVSAVMFSGLCRAESNVVQPRLVEVMLFKNGLAYFVCRAEVPTGADVFEVGPFTAAVHGTFWTSYNRDLAVVSTVAFATDSPETHKAETIAELLRANVGEQVSVVLAGEEYQHLTGRLADFVDGQAKWLPGPYATGRTDNSGIRVGGQLVYLETDSGIEAVDPRQVVQVRFPGGIVNKQVANSGKVANLRVALAAPAGAGQEIYFSYLGKGATWAPSYLIDISDSSQAYVAAKAVVINETMNFDGVYMSLITGYPNLQFSDIISPLSGKQTLAEFLQSLGKDNNEGRGRGNVAIQRVMYNSPMMKDAGMGGFAMPDYGAAESGREAEDLFLYPVDAVTLAKEETGYYPLFTEPVRYEHVYQWEIADYVDDYERYRQPREQQSEQIVWHNLKIHNSSKLPWTTAPATIVQDNIILGQDTLNYTAAGEETTVRITQALSIRVSEIENEVERLRDAAKFFGSNYDMVTVEGTLEAINYKNEAVTLEIEKFFSGELLSSSPLAELEKTARGLRRVNANNVLKWKIDMGAGAKQELKYRYKVYLSR